MNWIKAEDVTPESFQPGLWVVAYIFPTRPPIYLKTSLQEKLIHANNYTDLAIEVHFSPHRENLHAIYLGPHPIPSEAVEEIHRANNQAIYQNTLKALDE